MSFSLQTQQLLEPELIPSTPPSFNPLNHETGWSEVATGLNRVLIGYFLSFLCACLGVALLVWLSLQATSGSLANAKNAVNASVVLLIGGCLLGLLSLVSFGFVLVGKWACALHAPERHGARWFIFATITCLIVGPVVNIVFGIAGATEGQLDPPSARTAPGARTAHVARSIRAARAARADVRRARAVPEALTRPPTLIQLVGSAVSLATTLFFVLFLRAVGLCFGAENYSRMAELFLFFTGLLLAFTFYLLYTVPPQAIRPLVLLGLGAGWVASLLGYVALVIGARIVINVGLEQVRASRLT
jgi:hypothetical protein